MPKNFAYLRYRIINRYLKDHGRGTKQQLMDAIFERVGVEVRERTLEGDIHDMRFDVDLGWHAPIENDPNDNAYYYTDEDFSIDDIPINREELSNLKFAASMLSQYDHISYLRDFQGVVQKIVEAVNVRRMQEEDAEFPFIDFEKSPLIRGTDYLEPLIECIRKEEVLQLRYKPFTTEEVTAYIVDPYLLKEYNNRWYLVAWDREDSMFKIFGLERIEHIRVDENRRFVKKQIDFDLFFRHSMGITVPDREPEEIVVAFTEHQSKYLATKPIHESQALLERKDEKGRNYFSFFLAPTFEFTSMILGQGSAVEVISPEWYREEVANRIQEMQKLYR